MRSVVSEVTLAAHLLTRRFGRLTAVKELSLSARRGELLALLGPNGAGKTTLMRMLAGLLSPSSGEIRVLGQGGEQSRQARRSHLGYSPQRLIIWRDLTCLEQLRLIADMFRLGRGEGERRSRQLLETLGLSHRADDIGAHLSGGMQRRLSIALSMIHNPEILILDEPAAGLDPQSRVLVRQVIRHLSHHQGKTVIVSTHDIEEADRLADRVAIMDQGRLLVDDAPDQLKMAHGKSGLIEIALEAPTEELLERAERALGVLTQDLRRSEEMLVIDVDDGVELLRPIRTVLQRLNIPVAEIRLRKRSLEDVFIELTGRRLRE